MRPTTILPLLLVLAGCAASRDVTERPLTIEAVNDRLTGRWAVIERLDGVRLRNVRDVHVGPLYTRYDRGGRGDSLRSSDVRRIGLPSSGTAGRHALVFAAPGTVAAGFGGIVLLGADERSENAGAGIVAYSALLLGTGVAILGAGVGAMIGNVAAERHPVIAYEGPVARYETAP